MPTYSTSRAAPTYAGCVSLDAVIEKLAVEHAALCQMRSLGVVFHGVAPDGQVKLATSAPNVAARHGFIEDKAPAPAAPVPKVTMAPIKAAPPPKPVWDK